MDWHPIQGGSCDTASRSIIRDSWMDGIGCDTWLEHGLNVTSLHIYATGVYNSFQEILT